MNTALPTRPEEALRLSEDHYRVLFDEHPVPMWVYDPATLRFLSVNHAAVKQLRALDDMKNTFLNAVSHELRTPLAAVVGSATTLKNLGVDLTSEDQREMVGAIAENALKLQRLLSDLLDLDRLTRGALRPRLVATDIGELVDRVVADSEFLHDRPVEVEVHHMVFKVDPPKGERILENLLSNAIKYSPEHTQVWVRVKRVPQGAQITVEDLGPGVPEEFRPNMFEPFQQGSNTVSHS